MKPPEPCRFPREDIEAAAVLCRAYRNQFRLSRAQMADLLDTTLDKLADLERGSDPRSDRLIDAVFALAEDLE